MKDIVNKVFVSKCDYCKEITFDNFKIGSLWKPIKWEHLHIACLEKIIGRPLELHDLVIHPVNHTFLYHYSIWCPQCKYRKNSTCLFDKKECMGWCHLKTESENKLEGMFIIYEIKRRTHE